jgi:predicted metal-binding membrane protein
VNVPVRERSGRGDGLAPAYAALRTRRGLVALLLVLAVAGWWWTLDQMRGMDNGPWTGFGPLGWFLVVWVVMMAAMMLPSVAPTVALYSRMTRRRSLALPLLFATGYLLTWAAAGALAFAIRDAINVTGSDVLAWNHAGRWVAGVTLLVAAIYQMTPLKDVCLGKCRSPLGLLLGSWRDGTTGAVRMGVKNGAWCVGCCWALMAALIALGVMSLVWMAVVAALIAFEKTVPWRRLATGATTGILLVLGLLLLIAPGAIPGLTTPNHGPMNHMTQMNAAEQGRHQ